MKVYVNPFVCGLILGIGGSFVALCIAAIIVGRNQKK